MTSHIIDKVIPQIVGGDIGCGISCLNLNKPLKERQYEKIDNIVKSIIPINSKNTRKFGEILQKVSNLERCKGVQIL